jgi:DegV family protein with EDD domain
MKYKIIADSSCDLEKKDVQYDNIDFAVVPLTIHVDNKEFIDNNELVVEDMLKSMNSFKGKSSSSCPSPHSYYNELNGADKYFIITISAKLSSSNNSAQVARNMCEFKDDVFIIDSKATSGILILIIEKLIALIKQNHQYTEICTEINKYVEEEIGLLFILDKFDNLVKNGRVSRIKAFLAKNLFIKPICEAKDGEINMVKKAYGLARATIMLTTILETVVKSGNSKKCIISYCESLESAQRVKAMIEKKNLFQDIRIIPMRGLNSFYALEKGIILGFEK